MNINAMIPEKRMTDLSGHRYMVRHDGDDGIRESTGRFHRDDYFLIGVMISGQHSLSIDFEDFELASGNAVIIYPGQIHASKGKGSGKGFALALSPELLTDRDMLSIRELQSAGRIIPLPDRDMTAIISLYETLRSRGDKAGEADLAIVSAIKSIIIENIKPEDRALPGRYLRLAAGLQQKMELNIRTVKSPAQYASMLNVSGVYLNEAVKAVTGKTVSNLIGEYTTLLAKRELIYSDSNVREIAYGLGFEDYHYFSRLFRRHAGLSPKAFRDSYLE